MQERWGETWGTTCSEVEFSSWTPGHGAHTRVTQPDQGHVSGDTSGLSPVSLLVFSLPQQGQTTDPEPLRHDAGPCWGRVQSNCKVNIDTSYMPWVICWHFSWWWWWIQTSDLPSVPLFHMVSLLTSSCAFRGVLAQPHIISTGCAHGYVTMYGRHVRLLAEMWKIGVCSESSRDLEGGH